MNAALTEPISTDLRVILIDETEYWPKDLQEKCGRISCAYLYDNAVNVFCCEMTPSKELTPLYYVSKNEIDDETDEILRNEFAVNEKQVRYMKLLPEEERNEVKQTEANFMFTDARSKEYREELGEVEEACRCNPDF